MKTVNIVKNMGFVSVFLFLLVLFILVLLLYKLATLRCKPVILEKAYNFISNKLFFNTILRSILQSYLLLSVSTFLNMKVMYLEGWLSLVNLIFTVFGGMLVFFYPLCSFFFLEMQKDDLLTPSMKSSFASLYLDTRVNERLSR
mmetsp:Transcript_25587/g.19359  ORF Transcript_25587/g.19359 Transcript_25587/m.19359 type:complete len:144 (+) Transcript_25587:117-548(+)